MLASGSDESNSVRGGVAVPVEPDERLGAWESVACHPFFDECYSADGPLIAAMLGKLDSCTPTESGPFPESPHVEAKYWAELVRARRRIKVLQEAALEPDVIHLMKPGSNITVCCKKHALDATIKSGTHDPSVANCEPVQVDPQPHDSGSCPNGGGYSCTNHEPQTPTQVTEGGTQ